MMETYAGTLETNIHFYCTLNKINFIKGQDSKTVDNRLKLNEQTSIFIWS